MASRTKEIYNFHGLIGPGEELGRTPAQTFARELHSLDITQATVSQILDDLSYVSKWWSELKMRDLPLSDAAYRWSIEEVRALIFASLNAISQVQMGHVRFQREMHIVR